MVRKTCLHSCSLSIVYFSVTFMVPMIASVSVSQSATSSPIRIESAEDSSADSVIGMGQKRPFLRGQLVVVAAALPVVLAHEAVERRECADAHHDEVAGLAAGHGDPLEPGGLLALLLAGLSLEEERLQAAAAVGGTSWDKGPSLGVRNRELITPAWARVGA